MKLVCLNFFGYLWEISHGIFCYFYSASTNYKVNKKLPFEHDKSLVCSHGYK